MTVTYYYKNLNEIESHYSQTQDYVLANYEEFNMKAKKGNIKLSIGSFLKYIGLNIGELSAGGDFENQDTKRLHYILTPEQKLGITIKYLHDEGRLYYLTNDVFTEFSLGSYVIFEGLFDFKKPDHSNENIKNISSVIKNISVEIHFSVSKDKMEPSIYAHLKYNISKAPLSGLGTVTKKNDHEISIRPIAFGINFPRVVDPD